MSNMLLNQKDKSDYIKGLLVLAKKDRSLTNEEKSILKEIGNKLGFASEFIDESLFHLLQNPNISEEPVKFSDVDLAKTFIQEGIKLAYCDTKNPLDELKWLKEVAEINMVDIKWFEKEIIRNKNQKV
jgi:hypothetical protein